MIHFLLTLTYNIYMKKDKTRTKKGYIRKKYSLLPLFTKMMRKKEKNS